MIAELQDFSTRWEQRFLQVVADHVDGELSLVEGSRSATFEGGETLQITVEQGEQTPPFSNSGFYDCAIEAEYRFKEGADVERVSDTWNQIEQALGNGYLNTDPMVDRLQLGNLKIPPGESVNYTGNERDGTTRTLRFEMTLGEEN